MLTELPLEDHLLWKPADDGCHVPGPDRDWCETTWWSFYVPERRMAGWLYVQMRPNLGTVAGGAFVYALDAVAPWEQPYYAYQHYEPLPEPLDLTNATFRNGVYVRCHEPGMVYDIGYRFRDLAEFTADLHFEGITPPVPHLRGAPPFTGGSSHYDQHGRVTGTLQLLGERIAVDCIAMRDRSWGRRPEHIGRTPGRLSYAVGSTSEDEAFLVFCVPDGDDPLMSRERLSSGYLLRDGVFARLAEAQRIDDWDARSGGVEGIRIEGTDELGRRLDVTGTVLARLALPSNRLCFNSLMQWTVNGREGIGEDQDVWPMGHFADHLRAIRGL